jgi:hypothetical protein
VTDGGESLEQLRAEAAYRRARLALYRARTYALRATSSSKLRELERASEGAAERLRRAQLADTHDSAPGSD